MKSLLHNTARKLTSDVKSDPESARQRIHKCHRITLQAVDRNLVEQSLVVTNHLLKPRSLKMCAQLSGRSSRCGS